MNQEEDSFFPSLKQSSPFGNEDGLCLASTSIPQDEPSPVDIKEPSATSPVASMEILPTTPEVIVKPIIKENDPKIRRRWGKKEDRILFKVIYQLEKQGILTLEELVDLDPVDAQYHIIVRHLHEEFGWKSLFRDLIRRIKTRISDYFSHRDIKLMKRIIKKEYQYQNLDYEKIFYEFPGRSFQRVKEVADRI